MMKNTFVSVIFGVALCALVFLTIGCARERLGETAAEHHRRHLRTRRVNSQAMAEDVDTILLTDQPSKLTDKKIR